MKLLDSWIFFAMKINIIFDHNFFSQSRDINDLKPHSLQKWDSSKFAKVKGFVPHAALFNLFFIHTVLSHTHIIVIEALIACCKAE
jgi:hypothetical protein